MIHNINIKRLEYVTGILKSIGLQEILKLEEEDPQYKAVNLVARKHKPGGAGVLAVLNALASYRLTMRGEDWWMCWARHVTEKSCPVCRLRCLCLIEEDFLSHCKGSIIQRSAKKARVEKACRGANGSLGSLCSSPEKIFESGGWLVESLARALSSKPSKKTIVFAAKMAYYAARQSGKRRPAPWDVEIPVDVRVACFLYSTGIIEAPDYRSLVKKPEKAQEAVRILAERSGIPPLNLDTLFWLTGWMPRDLELGDAHERFKSLVGFKPSGLFLYRCR